MIYPDAGTGERMPDRTRKLIALDRALMEIGEPGVLERAPADLATLEAQLFGPPGSEAGAPLDQTAGRPPLKPQVQVFVGQHKPAAPEEEAHCLAMRAQFRLIQGGQARRP